MTAMHAVRLARVYDGRSTFDGPRILVDRMWPRGLSRAGADLDGWCRAIAPSDELRRWYAHVPARFAVFRERYIAELREPHRAEALDQLRATAGRGDITLVTATKALPISHAAVLAEQLGGSLPESPS